MSLNNSLTSTSERKKSNKDSGIVEAGKCDTVNSEVIPHPQIEYPETVHHPTERRAENLFLQS